MVNPSFSFEDYLQAFLRSSLWRPFRLILTWACYLILLALGWHQINRETRAHLHSKPKTVFIFPHTTYWDFWLMLIYKGAFPGLADDIYTVTKPQPFQDWHGSFLRAMNFMPATASENGGQGYVNSVTNMFRDKERYYIMMSPEGKLAASDWRSGYYHIAKGLDIPILVIGFDYEKKTFITQLHRYPGDYNDKDSMEVALKADVVKIVPLNPRGTNIQSRCHLVEWRSSFNPFLLASLITTFISQLFIYRLDTTIFYVGLLFHGFDCCHCYKAGPGNPLHPINIAGLQLRLLFVILALLVEIFSTISSEFPITCYISILTLMFFYTDFFQ